METKFVVGKTRNGKSQYLRIVRGEPYQWVDGLILATPLPETKARNIHKRYSIYALNFYDQTEYFLEQVTI